MSSSDITSLCFQGHKLPLSRHYAKVHKKVISPTLQGVEYEVPNMSSGLSAKLLGTLNLGHIDTVQTLDANTRACYLACGSRKSTLIFLEYFIN